MSVHLHKRRICLLITLLLMIAAVQTSCGASPAGSAEEGTAAQSESLQQPETDAVAEEQPSVMSEQDTGEFSSDRDRDLFKKTVGLDLQYEIGTFRFEEGGVCWLNGEQLSWKALGRIVGVYREDTEIYTYEFGGETEDGVLTYMLLRPTDDPDVRYYSNDIRLMQKEIAVIPEDYAGTWGHLYSDNDLDPIATEFAIWEDGTISINGNTFTLVVMDADVITDGTDGTPLFQQIYGSPDEPDFRIFKSLQYDDLIGITNDGFLHYFVKDLKITKLIPATWRDCFACSVEFEPEYDDQGRIDALAPFFVFSAKDGCKIWKMEDCRIQCNISLDDLKRIECDLSTGEVQLSELTESELNSVYYFPMNFYQLFYQYDFGMDGFRYPLNPPSEVEINGNILTGLFYTKPELGAVKIQGTVYYQDNSLS